MDGSTDLCMKTYEHRIQHNTVMYMSGIHQVVDLLCPIVAVNQLYVSWGEIHYHHPASVH